MTPIEYHKQLKGKIEVIARASVKHRDDLSLAYTPGVADPCLEIAADKEKVYDYTRKGNMVAVITDGSAVLGLGDIGPEASLPVMEGKCVLFKEFDDVDAFPIALKTQDVDEIVRTIELLSPMFGGINLEDISAPRCFEIEERLKASLDIPVFHDDQHGTAIVTLAGLINALRLTNRKMGDIRVVVNGVGAAGVAITKLIHTAGVRHITLVDSKGIICDSRTDLNDTKRALFDYIDHDASCGGLADALQGADVFIGVSQPNLVSAEMVQRMNPDAIIFAMANPTPEIMPDVARAAGAAVVATGRSDFPNQINNVLAFPGIFKGVLEARLPAITEDMKLAAAHAIADLVMTPTPERIIPDPFDGKIVPAVVHAVINANDALNAPNAS
jgi:malate dehydrogenase (oxaloacetate-decarboxylating)